MFPDSQCPAVLRAEGCRELPNMFSGPLGNRLGGAEERNTGDGWRPAGFCPERQAVSAAGDPQHTPLFPARCHVPGAQGQSDPSPAAKEALSSKGQTLASDCKVFATKT